MPSFPQNAADLAKNLLSGQIQPLGCRAEPCSDVVQAVYDSLTQPLGFGSLNEVTVVGDQIVLAVADSLPCMEQIVEGIVESLVDAGTDPDRVTVLLSEKYQAKLDELRLRSAEPVHWACHDPDREEELAYLATTEEGLPIVLNRLLIDADLVIPIGCFRTGTVYDYFGIHTPIFPTFTSREAIAQFGASKSQDSRGRLHKRQVHETDRIGWLLGVCFSIQVIPGRDGQVLEVIAGEIEQVRHQAIRAYRQAWHHQVSSQVGLVISILDDPSELADWPGLVQSLIDAVALLEPDGSVVILTHLSAQPGPAIRALIDSEDQTATLQTIRESRLTDAKTAVKLAELVKNHKVYLMSGLDEPMVEDLHITPIGSESELIRLSERFATAVVLEGAPFLTAEIAENKVGKK